jgi:vacuolar-type H+-ATPase subunit E/Vma4
VALPDLIARLERDAQGQVEAITQRADAEVRAIEAAAAREVADATTRDLAERRRARQVALQRELSLARRRARADELSARRAFMTRVFDRARALAAAAPRQQDAAAGELEEVLSYLEGLDVRVRCPAGTASSLQGVATRRGVRVEIDEAVGPGFVAEAVDGSVTIDHTLAARLARLEGQLAIDLMAEVGRERD